MSNEEYINDMKTRSVELEYEYWTIKVEAAKIEKEAKEILRKHIKENITIIKE